MDRKNFDKLQPLPFWYPADGVTPHFMSGMQFHAPFVITKFQQRSDLGECVVCTRAPRYVCKIHDFKVSKKRENVSASRLDVVKREQERMAQWIDQRTTANNNGQLAAMNGEPVRELVERSGMIYDEEFDEPRIIAKVPGMSVYIELLGCMDNIEQIDWNGEYGALATMARMTTWLPGSYDSASRKERTNDPRMTQPLQAWHDDYNPEQRPFMPKKCGLGHTNYDPTRRPELLHTHIPGGDKTEAETAKLLKTATVAAAERKIKPKRY